MPVTAQDVPPQTPAPIYLPLLTAGEPLGCQAPTPAEWGLGFSDRSTEGAIVEVLDGRAYVLTWLDWEYSRLAIYDMQGSRLGRLLDRSAPFQGFAVDVALHKGFAYIPVVLDPLSSEAMELLVFDLQAPEILQVGTRFVVAAETPHQAGITVWDGRLYVAAGAEGLKVYDLSDPAAPSLVGGHPDAVVGVAPYKGFLAVWHDRTPLEFAAEIDLRLFSLDDPLNPKPIGRALALADQPSRLVSEDGPLFVSLYTGTVLRFETDEAGQLRETGRFSVAGGIYDLALHRGLLAVVVAVDGEDATVAIFDARSATGRPAKLATVAPDASAYDVAWSEQYLMIGALDGLHVYDATDPAAPSWLLGTETTRSWAEAVAIQGNTAYVADTFRGLVTVDLSDLTRPRELAASGEPAEGVAVRDNLAFVVGKRSWEGILDVKGGASLQIFDVHEPSRPERIGLLPDAWEFAYDLAMIDQHLYLNANLGEEGVLRVDVSDPRTPRMLEPLQVDGNVVDLVADGEMLAVSVDLDGVQFWDLSQSQSPRLAGRIQGAGGRLALQGPLLATGRDFAGVDIFRWAKAEAENAGPMSIYGPLYDVFALTLDERRLAVADETGLRLLDLTAPRCAREVAALAMQARVTDLAFAGDYLIVLHGDGLLVVRAVIGQPLAIVGRLAWAG
jgi:hypothetical protein